jgi:hypothetical protein
LWGFRINWDRLKRVELIKLHLNNLRQPKEVPQFTKTGFKKLKIPEDLYQVSLAVHLSRILIPIFIRVVRKWRVLFLSFEKVSDESKIV